MGGKWVYFNPVPDEDHTGWWWVETVDIEPPRVGMAQFNIEDNGAH